MHIESIQPITYSNLSGIQYNSAKLQIVQPAAESDNV